jgi:alanine transaminase
MIVPKTAFIAASSYVAHYSNNIYQPLTRSPISALQATLVHNELPELKTSHEHIKRLTEETMSHHLKEMEYAVRGQVVQAAEELAKDLEKHPEAHPGINKILYTNIGNPHSVGQKSLSWPREVMALCNLPPESGVRNPEIHKILNDDVIARALEIVEDDLDGKGTGSYSHSQGHIWFREDIAAFLEKRDGGVKASADDIYMTNGASAAIEMVLEALLADETKGLMIPIPQYPIYSAQIALRGAHQVGYYLDEEKGWSIDVDDLEKQLAESKEKGIDVVGFVLINPGNPTGQVLSRESLYVSEA